MSINKYFLILFVVLSSRNLTAQPKELSIDTGVIKLKVNLTRGGAINYPSYSYKDRNLVNIFDEGGYIQQSYYAGNSLNRLGRRISEMVTIHVEFNSSGRYIWKPCRNTQLQKKQRYNLC